MPSSLGAFELELAVEPSQLPPDLKVIFKVYKKQYEPISEADIKRGV